MTSTEQLIALLKIGAYESVLEHLRITGQRERVTNEMLDNIVDDLIYSLLDAYVAEQQYKQWDMSGEGAVTKT